MPGVNVNYLPQSKATVRTVAGRRGLDYVQFDFGSQTLPPGASTSNGTNGGEGVTLIEAQWRSPWNTSNDWVAQGLATTWAVNPFVNVYDASGKLISGNPDLEPVEPLDNAQPIVPCCRQILSLLATSQFYGPRGRSGRRFVDL